MSKLIWFPYICITRWEWKFTEIGRIYCSFFKLNIVNPVLNIKTDDSGLPHGDKTDRTNKNMLIAWVLSESPFFTFLPSSQRHQIPHRTGLIEHSGTSQKLPKSPCLPSKQSMLTQQVNEGKLVLSASLPHTYRFSLSFIYSIL